MGAVGLSLQLEVKEGYAPLDVSSASAINVVIERPDKTYFVAILTSGSFLTDGKDGIIVYNTILGDLNQGGEYKTQAYIDSPTFKGYTTVTTFHVYPNIPY